MKAWPLAALRKTSVAIAALCVTPSSVALRQNLLSTEMPTACTSSLNVPSRERLYSKANGTGTSSPWMTEMMRELCTSTSAIRHFVAPEPMSKATRRRTSPSSSSSESIFRCFLGAKSPMKPAQNLR